MGLCNYQMPLGGGISPQVLVASRFIVLLAPRNASSIAPVSAFRGHRSVPPRRTVEVLCHVVVSDDSGTPGGIQSGIEIDHHPRSQLHQMMTLWQGHRFKLHPTVDKNSIVHPQLHTHILAQGHRLILRKHQAHQLVHHSQFIQRKSMPVRLRNCQTELLMKERCRRFVGHDGDHRAMRQRMPTSVTVPHGNGIWNPGSTHFDTVVHHRCIALRTSIVQHDLMVTTDCVECNAP